MNTSDIHAVRDDQALLEAARWGDSAAWDELVKRHRRHLFNFVRMFELDRHDADDLVQRTLTRALEKAGRFRVKPGGSVIRWLVRIARFQLKAFWGEAYRERFLRLQLMGKINFYRVDNEFKVCNKCGRRLKTTEFYRKCDTCDGLANRCKECDKSYQRERYAIPEVKAAMSENGRRWRQSNITRQRQHEHEYHVRKREANREARGRDASGYIAGSAQAGAYWKGHDARKDGLDKSACPYDAQTPFGLGFSRAWLLGWCAYERQREAKPTPKYQDKREVCPICGFTFDWTAAKQRNYWNAVRRGARPETEPLCGSSACTAAHMRKMKQRQQAESAPTQGAAVVSKELS